VPALERQLSKINGPMRQILEGQVATLKNGKKATAALTDSKGNDPTELERQATDLELQAKELRNKAEAQRLKAARAKLSAARASS
jgi:hypothetical protein